MNPTVEEQKKRNLGLFKLAARGAEYEGMKSYLAKNNVSANARNTEGEHILDFTLNYGTEKACVALLEAGANVEPLMRHALECGDRQLLEIGLAADPDYNFTEEDLADLQRRALNSSRKLFANYVNDVMRGDEPRPDHHSLMRDYGIDLDVKKCVGARERLAFEEKQGAAAEVPYTEALRELDRKGRLAQELAPVRSA